MPTTAHSSTNPTLLDIIKSQNPDGAPAKIVETLQKTTPLMEFLTWQQGNLETGHRITTETGLPSIGYRAFNEGVASGKFTTGQFDEVCGMMEGRSVLDAELAELNGNSAAYRAQYDMRFLRAFKNELETGMFYNSTATSPKRWNGLAPRYSALSGQAYSSQVIDSSVAGGTGNDQTSIWLVCFSPETVFAIYPKGQSPGLKAYDIKSDTALDVAGNPFRAYTTIWNWKVGLCVADGEAVVRIANIDTGSILATGKLLLDDMTKAYFRLRDPNAGRCAWFANRTVAEYLHNQAQDRVANSTLAIREDLITGRLMTHYMGIPILRTDALINTEAPIAERSVAAPVPPLGRRSSTPNLRYTGDTMHDALNVFSDNQVLAQIAGAYLSDKSLDLRGGAQQVTVAGNTPLWDVGRGNPIQVVCQVTETFVGATATFSAELIMADDAALTSGVVSLQQAPGASVTVGVPVATLVAGYQFRLGGTIPPGISKRYLGIRYNIFTATTTAGKMSAFLAQDRSTAPGTMS